MEYRKEISTYWRTKKANKIKYKTMIKQLKVRGEEHINHKGNLVRARRTGEPCKYVKSYIFKYGVY